ncbi:MAG: O-antigen ligase domain-containing protein [Tannerellaceae bacterium]|nr:O-antigen ligase domain-containing protein [Tannerellaceae bacterium]
MGSYIDRYFYILFIIALVGGVMLYWFDGFGSVDELCLSALLVLFFVRLLETKDWAINKSFLIVLGVFACYLGYSLHIGSNAVRAIFTDLLIQVKPYLAFFCVYQLRPVFDKKQCLLLKQFCFVCWVILIPFAVMGLMNEMYLVHTIGHPAILGASAAAIALIYLYTCEDYSRRSLLVFLGLLALGIGSTRSKFYGFFIFTSFLAFFLQDTSRFRLSIKNLLLLVTVMVVMTVAAKEKIFIYFVQGMSENADKENIARFALYVTSGEILMDYMPFGSGLASFATYASGEYYSPLYTKYGIDGVWGLTKNNHAFITDTYYPSLAQFGVAGVLFFLVFWMYLLRKAFLYARNSKDCRPLLIAASIIGYFAVENVADATLTSSRGFFFMMLLGLVFAKMSSTMEATLRFPESEDLVEKDKIKNEVTLP